jgi:hypothetical protein
VGVGVSRSLDPDLRDRRVDRRLQLDRVGRCLWLGIQDQPDRVLATRRGDDLDPRRAEAWLLGGHRPGAWLDVHRGCSRAAYLDGGSVHLDPGACLADLDPEASDPTLEPGELGGHLLAAIADLGVVEIAPIGFGRLGVAAELDERGADVQRIFSLG